MLNKFTKKEQETSSGKNWYIDRYQSVLVQRNVMAGFSVLALVFSVIAIILVWRNIPIVTVEPFVIQVEPRSGITQVVNQATMEELAGNDMINNYFLARYVRARESINASIESNYELVRVMSDPNAVFREYSIAVNPSNPNSLRAKNATQDVEIKSISRLDKAPSCIDEVCQAQVRVTITTKSKNQPPVSRASLIYLEFSYINLALSQSERYLNPLGFRVTRYREDQEIINQ